jgi:hypothetical protein
MDNLPKQEEKQKSSRNYVTIKPTWIVHHIKAICETWGYSYEQCVHNLLEEEFFTVGIAKSNVCSMVIETHPRICGENFCQVKAYSPMDNSTVTLNFQRVIVPECQCKNIQELNNFFERIQQVHENNTKLSSSIKSNFNFALIQILCGISFGFAAAKISSK